MTRSSTSPDPADATDDEALLRDLRSDDEPRSAAALREIIRQHGDAICAAAAREVDVDTACDIGQQLMIDLWERRTMISIQGSLRVYLLSAVRKQLVQRHRNEQTARRCLEVNLSLGRTEDENDALALLILEDGQSAIQALHLHVKAPIEYQAFRLSFYNGLSSSEIAKALHLSARTVNRHIQWVRTQIYHALLQRGLFEARDIQHFVTKYSMIEENHHA